jgi:hypothetical protein
MTEATRYDFASVPITGSEIDPETGYLKVWCRAARTGTQRYRRADGSVATEYRPEDEVSKPETLGSFGMKPVTWKHPPVLLDAENTKMFQVGHAGSQVRFSDGFVEVALLVTDKKAIDSIQCKDSADHAVEVSAGYRVDYDPTPGKTPSGEAYDGVQRNIRVNHIAIVPKGRAGPEVRLLLDRLDSTSAISFDQELLDPPESVTSAFPAMSTVRIKLDGVDVDVASDVALHIQAFVRDSARDLGELRSANTALTEELARIKVDFAELETEKEAAEGRADGLQAALDEGGEAGEIKFDEDNIDEILAQIPAARIDALVSARLDTLRTLAPAFDDDFVFDGIEEDALYMSAYENIFGGAPDDDMSIELMRGRVEGALATLDSGDGEEEPAPEPAASQKSRSDAAGDSTGRLRTALRGVQRKDAAGASEGYASNITQDWQRPLTASRKR